MVALEPAKISDFRLGGALGAGTTARVYEATHLATGRPVAIKVMAQAEHSHEMRERFAREALLLSDVESRHVSKILGFGFDRGQPFLVLERLRGETLDAKLRRDGPVPAPIAVRWIEQLIVGVRDCHDKQVIHRDIKPGNIFLHEDDGGGGGGETVKLIDFGVARLREITGDTGGLTSSTHVIGSMGYMAPEQFKSAKSVGFPADLYAIGVVIFRTLTGRLPFVSRSLEAVIRMKSEQQVPAISSMPGMIKNPLLDWFVHKAMAREPGVRFQNARDMLEHWWNVMVSLDEDGGTDIMRGIGRVDESYTGRRPEPRGRIPLPSQVPPQVPQGKEEPPPSHGSGTGAWPMPAPEDEDEDEDEDEIDHEEASTVRRPTGPATGSRPTPPSLPSLSERTAPGTAHDDVDPLTLRSLGDGVGAVDETAPTTKSVPDAHVDPFDVPTRSDPNLRKLVERELELQRARRREEGG